VDGCVQPQAANWQLARRRRRELLQGLTLVERLLVKDLLRGPMFGFTSQIRKKTKKTQGNQRSQKMAKCAVPFFAFLKIKSPVNTGPFFDPVL